MRSKEVRSVLQRLKGNDVVSFRVIEFYARFSIMSEGHFQFAKEIGWLDEFLDVVDQIDDVLGLLNVVEIIEIVCF